jgi:3-hydroxyacyl-[acyl-carrier-protein] dehydratase
MQPLTTHVCIAAEHPSLAGHFPGKPIVPGVVLLDMICAAIKNALNNMSADVSADLHLSALPSVKFQQPVLPEQILVVQVEFLQPDQHTVRARFSGTCEQVPILEGSMTFTQASAHAN